MRRIALDWNRENRGWIWSTTPDAGTVYSREERIRDLYIVRRRGDEKNPQALARKPSFLRCVFSNGMNVSFPSGIKRKRKTKLCERGRKPEEDSDLRYSKRNDARHDKSRSLPKRF